MLSNIISQQDIFTGCQLLKYASKFLKNNCIYLHCNLVCQITLNSFLCQPSLFQAQFLNLLLCRCFQLYYLEKHPEEAQDDSTGSMPRRNPSLLNHGFPLSVSALVSFRRAPFQGLLPGTKVFDLNLFLYSLHLNIS